MENLTPCKIVTPKNFILKLATRNYVEDITYYTIFDVDRFSGGLLLKQVKYNHFVTFLLHCPVLSFLQRAAMLALQALY